MSFRSVVSRFFRLLLFPNNGGRAVVRTMKPSKETVCLEIRNLLGNRFVDPEEIGLHLPGARYLRKDRRALLRSLPEEGRLMGCPDRRPILLPGPPETISMSGLERLAGKNFFYDNGFLDGRICPIRNDLAHPGWYLVRSGLVDSSFGKPLEEQLAMFDAEEWFFPNLTEAVWIALVLARVRGGASFADPEKCVRTSSVDLGVGYLSVRIMKDQVALVPMDESELPTAILPIRYFPLERR